MGKVIKSKLGHRIKSISEELNLPKATVERVIRAYLEGLEKSAMMGETIVIDNIMSIKPVINERDASVRLRGRVSPALKSKIYKFADEDNTEDYTEELDEDFVGTVLREE